MEDLPIPFIAPKLMEPCADHQSITLFGARHHTSGRIVFPIPEHGEAEYEPVALPRRGTIWSWTVQRFRPKTPPYAGPEAFTPYATAYVSLDDIIIVESRLVDIPFEMLRIGLPVQLTGEIFALASGEKRLTYAFTLDDEVVR